MIVTLELDGQTHALDIPVTDETPEAEVWATIAARLREQRRQESFVDTLRLRCSP